MRIRSGIGQQQSSAPFARIFSAIINFIISEAAKIIALLLYVFEAATVRLTAVDRMRGANTRRVAAVQNAVISGSED